MHLLLHALKSTCLNSGEVLTNLILSIWGEISKEDIPHSTCLKKLLHLSFLSIRRGYAPYHSLSMNRLLNYLSCTPQSSALFAIPM